MWKKNRSLILLVQSHLYSAINILRCFQRKQMVHLIAKPPLKLRAGVDCGLTARSRRINHEGCCTRSGRKINGERCGFCKKVLIKPGDAAQMHCWWQKRVGMLAFWLKSTPPTHFQMPEILASFTLSFLPVLLLSQRKWQICVFYVKPTFMIFLNVSLAEKKLNL